MIRLKELRKQKGDTLENLSKNLKEKFDLSLSTGQLSNYENENRTPRDTKIWDCIAEYFGVSVAYLLGYSGDEKNEISDIEFNRLIWRYFDKFRGVEFDKGFLSKERSIVNDLNKIIEIKKNEISDIEFNRLIWRYFDKFRGVEFDKGFLSKERSIVNDLNKIIEINEDTELSDDKKEEKISNLVNNLIRQFSLYSVFVREKILESKNKND